MKRTNSLVVAILLATAVFLNACQSKPSVGKCIPPPVTWEFPVMATITANLISDSYAENPPSRSWQADATLPQKGYIRSLVTRSSDDVWIIIDNDLFRYITSTQTWEKFSSVGDFEVSPKSIYVANDGTLWGIDLSRYNELDNAQESPLLMRYDEAAGRFEFVKDRDNILNSGMDLVDITEPTTNQNGELWMLLVEEIDQEYLYSLVSFDPANLKVIQHLTAQAKRYTTEPAESRFSDLAITSDGRVWIADYGKAQLLYYDPSLGKSNIYQGHPGTLDDISSEDLRDILYLYVDRMGRLWVDDRGWLDFTDPVWPLWHKVVRSPVFISDSASPENQYSWSRPDQMYQSSDGLYWFSDANVGMVNLDPAIGEWCKFTTGSSPISEDSQGNLWIAVFGKLYKYHMTP